MRNDKAAGSMRHPSLEVVFDDGGGITVQCRRYVHNYDDAQQAASDVSELLAGADPAGWDGNAPGHRIRYTNEQIRNGAYLVLDSVQLREATKQQADDSSWHNVRDFLAALLAALNKQIG